MNKRSIAKAFNEAAHNVFTQLPVEQLLLTKGPVFNTPDGVATINSSIKKFFDMFFTSAVQKKIVFTKTIVTWPHDDKTPFNPYVHKVEVFRYGNKYIMLILVYHQAT